METKTYHDVYRLRKAGQLQEALALAEQLLQADPDNAYTRGAYAWVQYNLLKQAMLEKDFKAAQTHLQTFDGLNMPPEEEMLHQSFNAYRARLQPEVLSADALSEKGKHEEALEVLWRLHEAQPNSPTLQTKIAWEFWRYLKTLPTTEELYFPRFLLWTKRYRELHALERPSKVHSAVLGQLLHIPPEWRSDALLLDWFRFWRIPEDFQEKDWLPYAGEGFTAPPLAERACNAWCRALIKEGRHLSAEAVETALGKLEAIHSRHPEYSWLPYFLAKIRIEALRAEPDKARATLLPFIHKKHKDFWAWDLLADTFGEQERRQQEACLCKALSCAAPPHFLTKVRQRLIRLLLERKAYAQARYEVEEIQRIKVQRKEQVPLEVTRWATQEDLLQHPAAESKAQQRYYQELGKEAEALVFGDARICKTGVIEGIDPNTSNVFFAVDKEVRGRFPGDKFRQYRFTPGDLFDFTLSPYEREGQNFWRVLHIAPPTGPPDTNLYRLFTGPLRQKTGQHFGFVGDAFVPANLISAAGATPGQTLEVAAVWTFDPKKQQYGWKAVKIA